MKKRIGSALLALALLLSLCPTAALAAEVMDSGKIMDETHAGIGSIYDSIPLSQLPVSANIIGEKSFDYNATTKRSFYNQLDDASQAAYDTIYAALWNGPSPEEVTIELAGKTGVSALQDWNNGGKAYVSNTLSAALGALIFDRPDFSWLINTRWGYGTRPSISNTAIAFYMTEVGYREATTDPDEVTDSGVDRYDYADTKDRTAIEAALTRAVNELGDLSGKSDYEKIKAVHNWICGHMKYTDKSDPKFIESWRGFQTPYSALVQGDTVCAGYAKSFKLLCDRCDIPCVIIVGTAGEPHAWNYVQIDDAWYAVDCTWDDSVNGWDYDYFLVGSENFLDHENGTLYSDYDFAYPDLSKEDYKDSNSPDSIDVTYTPKEDGISSKDVPYFMVPVISELGTEAAREVTFTAEPKKTGTPMSGQSIEWVLSSSVDGVTLTTNPDGTGTLKIDNSASSDQNPGVNQIGGYIVKVNAICGTTKSDPISLGVWVEHRVPAFVRIFKSESPVTTDTITKDGFAEYIAKVYDQYGQPTDDQAVTWSVNSSTVSVSDGRVTGNSVGTATVTATAGNAKAEVNVTVTAAAVEEKNITADMVTLFKETAEYNGSEQKPTVTVMNGTTTLTEGTDYTVTYDGEWVNAGDYTVTITGIGSYIGSVTKNFTIERTAPTINVDPASLSMEVNKTGTFKVEVTGVTENAPPTEDVTVTSDDESVATVTFDSETSIVTVTGGNAPGNTTITVTYPGDTNYNEKGATVAVTVTEPTHEHSYGAEWKYDDSTHWLECSCGAKENGSDHTWDEGRVTKEPTCTQKGETTFTCTVCDWTKTEEIPALGHDFQTAWAHDATSHWHKCSRCDVKDSEAAHTEKNEIIKAATCTEAGKTTTSCTVCGQVLKEETIDALGHDIADVAWDKGNADQHWHICKRCSEPVGATDHNWDNGTVTSPATCTAAGVRTFTCSDCGAAKTETIEKLAHNYSSTWSKDNSYHWRECTLCGDKKDLAVHTWNNGERTEEPTETEEGVMTYTCTVEGCGQTKTETIGVTGHDYSGEWTSDVSNHWHACTTHTGDNACGKVSGKAAHTWDVGTVTEEAACTAEGEVTYECTICHYKKTESIPATGHNIEDVAWTKEDDANHVKLCKTCHVPVETQAHTWNDGVITTQPTESAEGVKTFTCSACSATKTESVPKLDASHTHSWVWKTDSSYHWRECTSADCPSKGDKDSYGPHVYDNGTDTTCNTCGYTRTVTPSTPSGGGGGGGYYPYVPSTPSTPSQPSTSTLPVTTGSASQGSTAITQTTATPTASTSGGKAATTVNTTMGNEIVKQAVANNSTNVVIAPKVTGSVNKAEVSIPASTVGQIRNQTNASLTVSTPVADVTIPNGGLASLAGTSGNVTITAEQTGRSVSLSVTAGGRTVTSVPGGLTLTVPTSSATPGTVAVLVNADGTQKVVRKSVANNDAVTIPVDGSVKLELVDNSKYFTDVLPTSWEAGAVAFASAHELFNGTAPNQFSPNQTMSRGMLAVVLHNLESNPAQALTGTFADVNNREWYAEGVAWAAAKGIVGGYGNGQFGPNDNITREQLAVMLWRYAGSPASSGREPYFSDAYRISDWAQDALRWATANGIINGKGNGILDPGGYATRAETAQMLKNFMEKL